MAQKLLNVNDPAEGVDPNTGLPWGSNQEDMPGNRYNGNPMDAGFSGGVTGNTGKGGGLKLPPPPSLPPMQSGRIGITDPGQGPNKLPTPTMSGATGGTLPPVQTLGQVTGPNMSRDYLSQTISDSWAKAHGGQAIDPATLEQQIGYASKPDLYSDNKWRQGWNPYLEHRMNVGTEGAHPGMAGDEGIVEAPQGWNPAFGGGTTNRTMQGGSDADAGGGPLFQAILGLLRRGEKGVSKSDPNIAEPTAAYRAQAEHSGRQARSAMAERAAQQGLNSGGAGSGAFDSGIRSMLEQQGRDVGSYQGGLVGHEIDARRGDVRDALSLGNQSQQFYDNLTANMAQGNNNANLQQYLAILQSLGGA